MFLKNFHFTFIFFLITGTVIAASSNSWFIAWLGLEINLMSFIPLILSNISTNSSEAAIKYFITQAFASIFIMAFSTSDLMLEATFNVHPLNAMIFLALVIKAGMAPFHFWFPQVMILLSWFNCFIVLVWQKIAPFILMSYFSSKELTLLIITMSAIVGGLMGLNQVVIKLILTYSSIIHSGWMLMMSSFNIYLWANYFLIYSFLSSTVIYSSMLMKLNKISYLFNCQSISIFSKITFSFNIMSLGGLPPFLGFYAKLMAIMMSIKIFPTLILITLISMSLMSLFYYLKMIYSFSMLNSPENKMFLIQHNPQKINFFMCFSIISNCAVSALVLLT